MNCFWGRNNAPFLFLLTLWNWIKQTCLRSASGACTTIALVFSTLILGTHGNDILSDSNAAHDYVYTGTGDDIVIHKPSGNPEQRDTFDGGKGIDVLWLRMNKQTFSDPKFQADLIRFYYYVLNRAHPKHATGQGDLFEFTAMPLRLRNFEHLIVEDVQDDKQPQSVPLKSFQQLKDTRFDALATFGRFPNGTKNSCAAKVVTWNA